MNAFPNDWFFIRRMLDTIGSRTLFVYVYGATVITWFINVVQSWGFDLRFPHQWMLMFLCGLCYFAAARIYQTWGPGLDSPDYAQLYLQETDFTGRIKAALESRIRAETEIDAAEFATLLRKIGSLDLVPEDRDAILHYVKDTYIGARLIEIVAREYGSILKQSSATGRLTQFRQAQIFCYGLIYFSIGLSAANYAVTIWKVISKA
ncbi:hypothetical protein [Bradyrhizobium sp. SBR1B]|uniref:hypothetical protein n=1 Tax=Bradyrhizobium sp. SBR1B TaxID=2663836 RepID=UPI0016062648|nr:hypothetical protein [Bradyrhizobium sp. SBR1B]MBB4383501.1 hypothetical protein [Bradyrhizobium sp. SBR1B]